nr:MAG TPA: hypothetical protein [Caudoviricetes sp.]
MYDLWYTNSEKYFLTTYLFSSTIKEKTYYIKSNSCS